MIFKYFDITPKIIRPIVPIILKSSTRIAFYTALIDSGADYCIFGLGVAEALNIELKPQNKTKVSGVGKELVEGFLTDIEIKIGHVMYRTKVIFADISDFGHGILGQQGFFNHFDVKLSYQKQIIEIEPTKHSN